MSVKQPNLKLKTQPKQLLGSPLLDIALPGCYLHTELHFVLARDQTTLIEVDFFALTCLDQGPVS
jgi:hypothetical protein